MFAEQYDMNLIVYSRRNFSLKLSFKFLVTSLNYLQNDELCVWYMQYYMYEKMYICLIWGKVIYMLENCYVVATTLIKNRKWCLCI